MSEKLFTDEEIKILKQNKYVKRVGPKGITYTDEMKHFAISEWEKGVTSTQVFINAGFEPRMIGDYRVKSSMRRWKRTTRYSKRIFWKTIKTRIKS